MPIQVEVPSGVFFGTQGQVGGKHIVGYRWKLVGNTLPGQNVNYEKIFQRYCWELAVMVVFWPSFAKKRALDEGSLFSFLLSSSLVSHRVSKMFYHTFPFLDTQSGI